MMLKCNYNLRGRQKSITFAVGFPAKARRVAYTKKRPKLLALASPMKKNLKALNEPLIFVKLARHQ